MNLIVKFPALAEWNGRALRCAIGCGGLIAAEAKREGDGGTPVGIWPMRQVFYRPDRQPPPPTFLPVRALQLSDAWCDISGDPLYNRHVQLPYPTRDEKLWRDDAAYDLLVILGYNDDPVLPDRGSAIFLHAATPDFRPSAGCVTLALEDLRAVLAEAAPGDAVEIAAFGATA